MSITALRSFLSTTLLALTLAGACLAQSYHRPSVLGTPLPVFDAIIANHPLTSHGILPLQAPTGQLEGRMGDKPCYFEVGRYSNGYVICLTLCQTEEGRTNDNTLQTSVLARYQLQEGGRFISDGDGLTTHNEFRFNLDNSGNITSVTGTTISGLLHRVKVRLSATFAPQVARFDAINRVH